MSTWIKVGMASFTVCGAAVIAIARWDHLMDTFDRLECRIDAWRAECAERRTEDG